MVTRQSVPPFFGLFPFEAVQTISQSTQDFVGDSPDLAGNFTNGNLLPTGMAYQHGFIAGRNGRDRGYIHRELIHTDTPHEGSFFPMNQHLPLL